MKGHPLSEAERMQVLRLHATRRYKKTEIAYAARISRLAVIQVIDDAAAEFYDRCLKPRRMDELIDPHEM